MSNWMAKLTKDFGTIADDMEISKEQIIEMPSPSLNWAVGNGGIIEGKSLCLYGPESGGKSLLMQLMIKEIQMKDPEAIAILFDAEYSFNKYWFEKLGGDPKRLIVRQTNNPLKIFDYIEHDLYQMVQDGAPVKAIAIDSVKSIRYPKDHKKQSTDLTMGGGGASYLGPALKAVLPVIREHNITTLMVQQVYEELDPMKALSNPYKIPDGRALKHFCDYMLQVERIDAKKGKIYDAEMKEFGSDRNSLQVGHEVKVKVKKNRCGAPFRTAKFKLSYDSGIIGTHEELAELAKSLGVAFHPIGPSGKPNNQMWQIGDHDPVRGWDNFVEWLGSDVMIVNELIDACNGVSDEKSKQRNEELKDDSDIDLNLDEL